MGGYGAAAYAALSLLVVFLCWLAYSGVSFAGYVLVLWGAGLLLVLPWLNVIPAPILTLIYSALAAGLLLLVSVVLPGCLSNRERLAGLRRLLYAKNRQIEQERRNLVSAIHDEINPQLILAKLEVEQLKKEIGRSNLPPKLRGDLLENSDSLLDLLQKGYDTGRTIINGSRFEVLETIGLVNAIKDLVGNYSGVLDNVQFDIDLPQGETMLRLDKEVAINLFSIVREALLNAVKHASASVIRINVLQQASRLIVEVADNGCGLAHKTGDGLGLIDLQERASAIGADLSIESRPRLGTTIRCSVPV